MCTQSLAVIQASSWVGTALGPPTVFTPGGGAGAAALQGNLACGVYASDYLITEAQYSISAAYILYSGSLVFLMQCGFAMLCAGSVRQKNVKNILLKNLMDAAGGAIAFWAVGYAFAYGDNNGPFIGTNKFFLADLKVYGDSAQSWFFQWAFAATAATIVAGTVAERCKMVAYFFYSAFLTGFVYPIVVRSIWAPQGWASAYAASQNFPLLFGVGMIDFAGSGVVHLTGGTTALVAAIILGPRIGRFRDENGVRLKKPGDMSGHSVTLQVLGTFLLWFGWYGFNPGSVLAIGVPGYYLTAGLCAVNTTLAAASGAISAMTLRWLLSDEDVFDITAVCNGALSGLVAITAGCATVWPWASVVIGLIGGIVYIGFSNLLLKLEIDDAVDAIPVHFANGIWGCIATGLFSSRSLTEALVGSSVPYYGWFYNWSTGNGYGNLLAAEIVGCIWIICWCVCLMGPFFLLLKYLNMFRVDELEEEMGLDVSHHGGPAYPSEGDNSVKVDEMKAKRESAMPAV